jgi:hypothetical protein
VRNLKANIWLTDMPARATVEAQLAGPGLAAGIIVETPVK